MDTCGTVRFAEPDDCEIIARIYNEGIAEGRSTFEPQLRTAGDIDGWLGPSSYPVLVAERERTVVGWARLSAYSARPCYTGVGEASVYVSATARGRGLGTLIATALRDEAERAGFYKVIGKLFVENEQSRRLAARHGFREVGVHRRHGTIEDEWRDVLVVELLLGDAATVR
jgi:phosphinothricin acetyltransferase